MTENSQGTAPLLALPKKKYVVIDVPARVKNVDRAVEMLGGMSEIEQVVKNEKQHLELKFCEQGHPLFSDTTKTQNLLVKIIKTPQGISYQTLGIVSETIQFQGMMDYQYKLKGLEITSQLGLPPVLFTRKDRDVQYLFKDNPSSTSVTVQKDGHTETTRSVKVRRPAGQIVAVPMTEDFVPPDPPELGPITDHFERIIQQLFQIRPIWTMKALKAQCTSPEELKKLKKVVSKHSYYFQGGPWRSLWVRFDVNPTTKTDYAKYQILDLRLPPEWKEKISTRKSTNPSKPVRRGKKETFLDKPEESVQPVEEEENLDFVLDTIPTQMQCLYQICDVPLKKVEQMMKDTQRDWNVTSGWYKKGMLDKMRKEIKNNIEKWLESGVKQSDLTNVQKLYREDAEKEVAKAPQVDVEAPDEDKDVNDKEISDDIIEEQIILDDPMNEE